MQKLIPLLSLWLIVSCQPQEPQQRAAYKTMMIRASGNIEALPNMATFRIQLNCLNKSVKLSQVCLVEKSNELNKRLLDLGISQDDILTTSVNMQKSYTWNRNTRILEGYNSATEVYVTVKDLEKLNIIYTELLENRNLELDGLSYAHAQIDSLKNEAYLKALNNAKVLANKLITELPESSTEILKIGNVEIAATMPGPTLTNYGDAVAEEAQSAANRAIAISKGTVMVEATLFVEFLVE